MNLLLQQDLHSERRSPMVERSEVTAIPFQQLFGTQHIPWYQRAVSSLRDFRTHQDEPEHDHSELVVGRSQEDLYPCKRRYFFAAFGFEISFVSAILVVAAWHVDSLSVQFRSMGTVFVPEYGTSKHRKLFMPSHPNRVARAGGGGGGKLSPPIVSRGAQPKPAPKQFIAPMMVTNPRATLMVPITVEAPLIDTNERFSQYGDPLSKVTEFSHGKGSGGGIGEGRGSGFGTGSGAGAGPASGSGVLGSSGSDTTRGILPPQVKSRVDPEYTQAAKDAHYEGVLIVSGIIFTNGRAGDLRVLRGDVHGLGRKAIAALTKWEFVPAMKNGRACPLEMTIEVWFRLR